MVGQSFDERIYTVWDIKPR